MGGGRANDAATPHGQRHRRGAGQRARRARRRRATAACFEELYRRHAPAAWRVAYAVAGNPDDAADAVSDAFTRVFQVLPEGRPQASRGVPPLPARRHPQRRPRRPAPPGPAPAHGDRRAARPPDGPTTSPPTRCSTASTRNLVAVAFRSLPERWRSVLWLTEVEGIPAREAAPMLGVSANGLAQLAVRARAGLRQRFLQAHLRAPVARACQFPVDKLGAYIAGGLSPRETAKVDQHLAGCADCRQQVEELEDLGSLLRRVVTPVPLALAAVSLSKWKLAMKSVSMVSRNPALQPGPQARSPPRPSPCSPSASSAPPCSTDPTAAATRRRLRGRGAGQDGSGDSPDGGPEPRRRIARGHRRGAVRHRPGLHQRRASPAARPRRRRGAAAAAPVGGSGADPAAPATRTATRPTGRHRAAWRARRRPERHRACSACSSSPRHWRRRPAPRSAATAPASSSSASPRSAAPAPPADGLLTIRTGGLLGDNEIRL